MMQGIQTILMGSHYLNQSSHHKLRQAQPFKVYETDYIYMKTDITGTMTYLN